MDKLGEGGEAEVFAIDEHRVLRRFRRADHPAVPERIALTREVAAGARHLDVAVPEILDVFDDDEGRPCFVERRLPGRSLTDALADVTGARRTRLLASYLDTAVALRGLDVTRPFWGELAHPEPLRAEGWTDYLLAALDRQSAAADPAAYPELDDLSATFAEIAASIHELDVPGGANLGSSTSTTSRATSYATTTASPP